MPLPTSVELTKLDPGTVVVVVVVDDEEGVEAGALGALSLSDPVQAGTVNVTTAECGVTFSVLCHTPFQDGDIPNTRTAYESPTVSQSGNVADVARTFSIEYSLKSYDPDSSTRTHCIEYQPVSGDAPRHDTDTGLQPTSSRNDNTGATTPVDDTPCLRPTHTRSPTRNGEPDDARFNRYKRRSLSPNRTASRDHESFGNAT
jgi:hypothetical protein